VSRAGAGNTQADVSLARHSNQELEPVTLRVMPGVATAPQHSHSDTQGMYLRDGEETLHTEGPVIYQRAIELVSSGPYPIKCEHRLVAGRHRVRLAEDCSPWSQH
jgi:hypothetical protein